METAMTGDNGRTVLEVNDLKVYYATPQGDVKACDGVTFGSTRARPWARGRAVEQVTATSGVLQLISPPGRIAGGEIVLDNATWNVEELRSQRWRTLSLIPKGAMNSLQPHHEDQRPDRRRDRDPCRASVKPALKRRILDLFQMVGLPARIYDARTSCPAA